MLWRTGFLSRPSTRPQIRIPRLSLETVVWIISSRCVLELKYGKAGIPVFFHIRHPDGGRFRWWQLCLAYQWATLFRGSSNKTFLFLYKKDMMWGPFQMSLVPASEGNMGQFSCPWYTVPYLINQSKIVIAPFCNASFIFLRICTGWSVHSPVLVCYHLSVPKRYSLVEVMLMLDEVWITIHLLSW